LRIGLPNVKYGEAGIKAAAAEGGKGAEDGAAQPSGPDTHADIGHHCVRAQLPVPVQGAQ
jgi:hypothetical protein